MPGFKSMKEQIIAEVIADINGSEYMMERLQHELDDAIYNRLREHGVEGGSKKIRDSIRLTIAAERI